MERQIVLLRGINVGGKNLLSMKLLTQLCTELGGQNVRTYIQSGNVALDVSAPQAVTLAAELQRAIATSLGLALPVVLRAQKDLQAVLAVAPWPGQDLAQLHVAFLADLPTAAQVAALDPQRSPPDEFLVRGREVFLRVPNGLGRTKLTNAWLDAKLQTVSTVRNWRTVQTLAQW